MCGLSTREINDLIGDCEDLWIFDGLVTTNQIINDPKYKNIMCSISGGSDSDIVLDICYKLDFDKKIQYVWFDTGLEYQATKDHLKYLEEKYGIEIIREKAIKTIPYTARKNGQPFVSKQVSENMERLQKLQKYGFHWEDEDFETLVKRYCKKADETKRKELNLFQHATDEKPYGWLFLDGDWYTGNLQCLRWWCNAHERQSEKPSRFSIGQNTWLKEFIIKYPPTFPISAICCKYAKKDVAKKFMKEHNIDLSIMGIRKSEGGVRATAYKTCYTTNENGVDYHRPIFWYSDETKRNYEEHFGITHSRCYTEYGMVRTGCAGCPLARKLTDEVNVISNHEQKLYGAINKIFGDTYEYTRKYRAFQKEMKEKHKCTNQISMYDLGVSEYETISAPD